MTNNKLRFEIFKHNSTTFHFDLSLEIGGEMKLWSIPKGPTLDNKIKRLSIGEEEHHRKYGEGPSEIWDQGTYIPEVEVAKGERKSVKEIEEANKIMAEGLEKGEIKFFLEGAKIKGSFALIKTKGFPPGVKNAWLLIKHDDEFVIQGYEAKDES